MQRFDQWLTYGWFGIMTDDGTTYPGGVNVHETYGTTGASYSPEVGNPQGHFYPGKFQNPSDQSTNVVAQGTIISMPSQIQPGGRMSSYNILGATFKDVGHGQK
jgi:hypothetical protein